MNGTHEDRMTATRDDKLMSHSRRRRFPVVPVLLGLVVLIALVWWLLPSDRQEPVEAPETPLASSAEAPPLPPAEDIPRPEEFTPAEPELDDSADEFAVVAALPTLEESDSVLREELSAAGVGSVLEPLLQSNHLAQMLAALADGSSRGTLPPKKFPLKRPKEPFAVEQQGGASYMSAEGYSRYDRYVEAVVQLDPATLAANFHRFRPLFEQAYAQLGLDPGEFDNAVIRSLDRVLETPEIEEPIALEQKSVMYLYANPELEALTPIQKQLLRMGPDNLRRLKAQARKLRENLLQE